MINDCVGPLSGDRRRPSISVDKITGDLFLGDSQPAAGSGLSPERPGPGLSHRGFSPISARPGARPAVVARMRSRSLMRAWRGSEVIGASHHQGIACLTRPPSDRRFCATQNLAPIRQPWSRPVSRRCPIAASRDYLARCAMRLRESGLDRDARVAVALPSGADGALAIVATACAAVAVPIDIQLTAPEIAGRFESLRPRAVIVPRDGPSAAREAAMGCGVAVIEAVREGRGSLGLELRAPKIGARRRPSSPSPPPPPLSCKPRARPPVRS